MCTAEQNEIPRNFTSDTINLLSAHYMGLLIKKEENSGNKFTVLFPFCMGKCLVLGPELSKSKVLDWEGYSR